MLIVLDIDDTILARNSKEINDYTINIFKKLNELGHLIVYNTARDLSATKFILNNYLPNYFIFNSGSQIYDNNYNVVYCSGIFNQKETNLVQDVVLGSKIVRLDNVEYNMYISTLSNTRWKVAIFTNYESISSTLSNFLIILIILTIVIIVVEGGILYFSMLKEIKQH